jgi:hypothetical protein
MSDGPFRSLPMNRKWKKVAEFADNSAASLDDISHAILSAMHQEWNSDIPVNLMEKIYDILRTPSLFGNTYFEDLRQLVIGKPIANSLLNYFNQSEYSNLPEYEMIIKTISKAVVEKSERVIRQIQEHYIRKSDSNRSMKVVSRIRQAFQAMGYENLARKFIDPKPIPAGQYRSIKTGLDEGVKI